MAFMRKMRLMEADEIVRAGICKSERHARRLRQTQDARAFAEVHDPIQTKPDLERELYKIVDALGCATVGCYSVLWSPEKYSGAPVHIDDIYEAVGNVMDSINELREVVGIYEGRDGENGDWCKGLPTIYRRAVSGLPVHIDYKKRVEAWAAKYGKKIKCEFFGVLESEEPEDTEPIVTHTPEISATITPPSSE